MRSKHRPGMNTRTHARDSAESVQYSSTVVQLLQYQVLGISWLCFAVIAKASPDHVVCLFLRKAFALMLLYTWCLVHGKRLRWKD